MVRLGMAALVKSRVAHQISYEDYMAGRLAARSDRAECDRRMAAL